jgi:hypothetical protein
MNDDGGTVRGSPSSYIIHRERISKKANTDVSLGITVRYTAFDGESPAFLGEKSPTSGTKLNRTKVLIIDSVQPDSVLELLVKVGDIICFLPESDSLGVCSQSAMPHNWAPVTDVQFLEAIAKSRQGTSFTIHLARKKQTSYIGNVVDVDNASQEWRCAVDTVQEGAGESQVENVATASLLTVSRKRDRGLLHADDTSALDNVYQNLIDLVCPKYESEWQKCCDLHRKLDALDSERHMMADAMKKCYQSLSLSDGADIETSTSTAKSVADNVHELPPRIEIPPLDKEDEHCWAKIGVAVDVVRKETRTLHARNVDWQKKVDCRQAVLADMKSDIETLKATSMSALEAILEKANDAIQK